MSFAAAEARANAAVFRRLANAQAAFAHAGGGTAQCNVVFDPARADVTADSGVLVTRPVLMMQPDAAPLAAEADTVVLTRLDAAATPLGSYVVRSVAPLAEGGMQRLVLAQA